MSKTSIEARPGSRLVECRTSGETMGTRYSARFQAPAGADLRRIVAELGDGVGTVDRQMSNWKPDSDLSRLNRAASGDWVRIPAPLATVLARALDIGRQSGNAFDIGVGDLVSAWGFGPVPASSPPDAARARRPRRPVDELLEVDVGGGRARRRSTRAPAGRCRAAWPASPSSARPAPTPMPTPRR